MKFYVLAVFCLVGTSLADVSHLLKNKGNGYSYPSPSSHQHHELQEPVRVATSSFHSEPVHALNLPAPVDVYKPQEIKHLSSSYGTPVAQYVAEYTPTEVATISEDHESSVVQEEVFHQPAKPVAPVQTYDAIHVQQQLPSSVPSTNFHTQSVSQYDIPAQQNFVSQQTYVAPVKPVQHQPTYGVPAPSMVHHQVPVAPAQQHFSAPVHHHVPAAPVVSSFQNSYIPPAQVEKVTNFMPVQNTFYQKVNQQHKNTYVPPAPVKPVHFQQTYGVPFRNSASSSHQVHHQVAVQQYRNTYIPPVQHQVQSSNFVQSGASLSAPVQQYQTYHVPQPQKHFTTVQVQASQPVVHHEVQSRPVVHANTQYRAPVAPVSSDSISVEAPVKNSFHSGEATQAVDSNGGYVY